MSMPEDGRPRPIPELPGHVFDMFSMKGKVTIVSGGSGGIGWEACCAVAEAGGDVAILYNSASGMDERAAELGKKNNVRCKAYKVNVRESAPVKQNVEDVVKDFGRIDCYIANAGAGASGGVLEISEEDWHKGQQANYYSVFYAMKAVGPHFKAQGSGSFIATTSISAHIVNIPVDQPAYNAAKAATLQLCRCVAREWRMFARVNTISPGFYTTNMGASDAVMPYMLQNAVLGREGDVRELKGSFLLLASNASTYTTGADLVVDGGYLLS